MYKDRQEEKTFYNRYWSNEHIKINIFDNCPEGNWIEDNFLYHLKFFKPFIKGRLLDFGCGDGYFLHMISKYCNFSCGVDISETAIDKARHKYPGLEFKILEEGGRLPYTDNYFDTVCAIDVLEHVLDIEGVLEEINRVLKPGGNLLIATSELTRIKILLIALRALDSYFYPASAHIRYFTRKNLADILKRKNFEVIKYQKNRTYFGFIPKGQMVVASKGPRREI